MVSVTFRVYLKARGIKAKLLLSLASFFHSVERDLRFSSRFCDVSSNGNMTAKLKTGDYNFLVTAAVRPRQMVG